MFEREGKKQREREERERERERGGGVACVFVREREIHWEWGGGVIAQIDRASDIVTCTRRNETRSHQSALWPRAYSKAMGSQPVI